MFVSNWRTVVRKSLSFWGNILIAVAMGVAGGFAIDGPFYWSMAVANFAVAILGLVFQKGFADGAPKQAKSLIAAVVAISVGGVATISVTIVFPMMWR